MSNFFQVNIVVPLHSKCLKNLQVGTADEKLRSHSTKELSQRWPLALFFNLLDVVFFDAYVICNDTGNQNFSKRKFLLQLDEVLQDTECQRRKESVSRFVVVVEINVEMWSFQKNIYIMLCMAEQQNLCEIAKL